MKISPAETRELGRKIVDQAVATDAALDGLSRSIQRMRSIVEMEGPPILLTNELDLMERRLAALRRS